MSKKKDRIITKCLISVSGGNSSARMLLHMLESEKYKGWEFLIAFSNTSLESDETYDFLENLNNYIGNKIMFIEPSFPSENQAGLNYDIVPFENLNREGLVFEKMMVHVNSFTTEGVPNIAIPYCSTRLKKNPLFKLGYDYFGTNNFVTAIGFRAEDMPKRITVPEIKEARGKTIYPLLTDFENPLNHFQIMQYMKYLPFQLGILSKFGNCELCFKKSLPTLVQCVQRNPSRLDWYKSQENNFGNSWFRENKNTRWLELMANSGEQMTMFDDHDESCSCSF